MNIAYLFSNYVKISPNAKKGTELVGYIILKGLVDKKINGLKITTFGSGDSTVPTKLESISLLSLKEDKQIEKKSYHFFEEALIAQAFQNQDNFDLYHVHIGNGEIVLPFASFVRKPILITLHGTLQTDYGEKYFSLFKNLRNIFFISISNNQRRPLPFLNYIKTIYHGINQNQFLFNQQGGERIVWTGRGVPEKGPDVVVKIAQKLNKKAAILAIEKENQREWFNNQVVKKVNLNNNLHFQSNLNRTALIPYYQRSKLFLFPLSWEEPFGMTMVEAMSCGTPVVAYARGSVPEIVRDGETGFIVNSSDNDIRGNWIIKKTGVAGLIEAVNKIYAMPKSKYAAMRYACRRHVEHNFTLKRMVDQYVEVYQEVINQYQNR